MGQAIHKKLTHSPWEGTSLLKIIYGHLYNGKLATRFGHALTAKFSLCYNPDPCTHIAGKCPDHEALRISRHNAACQLVHDDIRKPAKEGRGGLYSAPDLVLVMADTDTQPLTTGDSIEILSPISEDTSLSPITETPHTTGSHPCPRRRMSAVDVTPMSHMTPNITIGVSPPQTETLSAPRHPAAYRIGLFHRGRLIRFLKPDMAQHQTSSMQQGSHTLPPQNRPLLT